MPIKFGTDGWRDIIAEDFTFENVRLCAQGAADMLLAQGDRRQVVVGYDTRFGSQQFAEAVAETLASNGLPTLLANAPASTPAIGYNVVARSAGSGIVITASHNPPEWNGFKFKPDYGGSAPPDVAEALERYVAEAERRGKGRIPPLGGGDGMGSIERFDATPPYLARLAQLVDLDGIRSSGLRLVVDSMHGSGAGYFASLLNAGGSAPVVELRGELNPAFPGMAQPEPLAQNLAGLMARVKDSNADAGLATDGDADRLGVVDHTGRFVSTLDTFALLCYHQLEVLGNRGPLARSITMTRMIDRLGERYSVPVYETPVGFKHLGPLMMRKDALAAGEESGGYAFRGHIPERDGIFSGLLLLDLMSRTGRSISELLASVRDAVGPHFYDRVDLRFDDRLRASIQARIDAAHPSRLAGRPVERVDTQDGRRFLLAGGHWALVRFSGTEPLLRVYAEGESAEMTRALIAETRALAGV